MYTFARNTQYLAPKWRAYVTPYELGFRFTDGVTVTSLWELKHVLLTLDEGLINPWIQSPQYHLSTWVRDSVGDDELAELLKGQTQRWGAVVALERQMMRTLNLPYYVAKRWLAPSHSPFVFSGGTQVAALDDLAAVLPTLSDETLRFHYARFPNDLSVWLADVIGDYYLSDALEEVNSREQAMVVVDDHLVMLHEAASTD